MLSNITSINLDLQTQGSALVAKMINNIEPEQVFVTYATFALAVAGLAGKAKRFVQVTTDETNSNQTTLYWWTGTALQWIPTVEV